MYEINYDAICSSRGQFYFNTQVMMLLRTHQPGRKERNVLFNDALNTFYLRLYGVKDHMENSFRLAARVILYASYHSQDNTYHRLC